jgi:hypothetical protein
MSVTATHYGTHAVSGTNLKTAIDNTAITLKQSASGARLHLAPTANGTQIAVIKTVIS